LVKRALAVGAVLALALGFACRIPDRHFQVRGDAGSDAAIDGSPDAMVDAMPDANLGPCDLTAPWGPLTRVNGLGSARSVARFTDDELTAYFALGSDGTPSTTPDTLYVATRTAIGSAFGAPVKLTGVNGSDGMSTPAISPDGSTIYYVWGEPPNRTAVEREIYGATRTGSANQFGSGSDLPFNIAGSADDFPWVTADGDVWWSSIRNSDNGFYAIYRVQATGGGTFGTTSRTSNLDSTTDDNTYIMLDKAQLRAWFMRNSQVYTSTRPSLGGSYATPVTVDELNNDPVCTGHVCRPAWITSNSCRIYIGGGVAPAGFLMYYAEKPANP
jgi:hypothetical protein